MVERRRRRRIDRRKEVEVEVCASGDRCLLRLVFVRIYLSLLHYIQSTHRTEQLCTQHSYRHSQMVPLQLDHIENQLTVTNDH